MIPYYEPKSLWASASTAPIFTIPSNVLAAFSYSGASALQCPHHGAKNSTIQIPFEFNTFSLKFYGVSYITLDLESYKAKEVVKRSDKKQITLYIKIINTSLIYSRMFSNKVWVLESDNFIKGIIGDGNTYISEENGRKLVG